MNTRFLPGSTTRNASRLLRRGLLSHGLLAIVAGGLLAGCAATPEDPETKEYTEDSPSVEASPGPQQADIPSNQAGSSFAKGCPSPEALLAIKACPDCTVLRVARVDLPMLGRSACTAKILDADGEGSLLTTLDDGSVADEKDLLEQERALYRERYGALTPELAEALNTADADDLFQVWLWARLELNYPDKNEAIAFPEVGRKFAEEAHEKAIAAREPILAALEARGFQITDEGGAAPMIRAIVPAHAIRELAHLPEVVALGTDDFPGRPASTAFYQTDRADTAQTLSSGSGQGVCLIEAGRPDVTSQLELADTASPNGATDWHIRLTSGIVRNTSTIEMAPAASIFIGNWDQYAGTPTAPTVHEWCTSKGATTINFSWSFTDGSPGGLTSVDMQEDYFTKLWPYPLYVPAAGNSGCVANFDTVQNRGFNALVVGGSDDKGTTNFYDDTLYNCSSFRNPTSAHSDRELPAVVAPAVNIEAASANGTGTSFAAPQVSGTVALVAARGSGFGPWPEMKRAAILATAVRNIDGSAFGSLPAGDIKDGAGALDAAAAVQLADPANFRYANSTASMAGYSNTYLNFSTDFTGSVGNPKWNIQALPYGGHLRVAIAWDGSATCGTSGTSCSADTLDGDLDLHIYDAVTGSLVCSSSSYDSSWEACDFAPVGGRQYRAELRKYTTTATSTYLGIAWYAYN